MTDTDTIRETTPIPWSLMETEQYIYIIANSSAIAALPSGRQPTKPNEPHPENLANAALIVRAVNAFDQLVNACRLLVMAYDNGEAHGEHVDWSDIDLAHAAAVEALKRIE